MGKGTSGKGEKGFAGGLGFWGGVEQSHSGGLASSNYVSAHNILDTRKELDQFFCINAVRYRCIIALPFLRTLSTPDLHTDSLQH